MYIGVHINFEQPIYYENYTETSNFYNVTRLIMGILALIKGYKGVSSKYLLEIIIKIVLAIILSIYLIIDNKIYKNENINIEDKEVKKAKKNIKVLSIIAKIIICTPLIIMFLLSLYMIYYNIHSIR